MLSSEQVHPHLEQYLQLITHREDRQDVLYFVIHSIDKGTCWFAQCYEKIEVEESNKTLSQQHLAPSAHNKQIISNVIKSVHEDWKTQNTFTAQQLGEESLNHGYIPRTIDNESSIILWKIPPKSSFCYSMVCTLKCNIVHAENVLNNLIQSTAFKKDGVTPVEPRDVRIIHDGSNHTIVSIQTRGDAL